MLRVTARGLNLRSGPGPQFSIVRELPRDTALVQLAGSAGWFQVRTFDGAQGWVSTKHAVPDGAPWMSVVRGELGVIEVVGGKHNPRIIEYHGTTTLKATSDEVPWCSAFANWCTLQTGILGTRLANARSWLNWGVPIDDPRPGCIVILARGLNPSSGHVAFYEGAEGEQWRLLGGNQGNSVCVASFRPSHVLGCRWPLGAP